MSDVPAARDEVITRASWLLTHHDRYGRESVIAGRPDVFVVGDSNSGFDIALRLDGSYSDREMAESVALGWLENVRKLSTLLREVEAELIS